MNDDLYQQAIMTRARDGARAGRLPAPDASVTLDNPLCGDRVTLDVKLADGRIADIRHTVRGCALCQASAAMIAEAALDCDAAATKQARAALRALLAGGDAPQGAWAGLSIFAPVAAYKSRHDCVLLPFDALERALSETVNPQ